MRKRFGPFFFPKFDQRQQKWWCEPVFEAVAWPKEGSEWKYSYEMTATYHDMTRVPSDVAPWEPSHVHVSATCRRHVGNMLATCPCLVSFCSSPPKTFLKKTFPAKWGNSMQGYCRSLYLGSNYLYVGPPAIIEPSMFFRHPSITWTIGGRQRKPMLPQLAV